AGNWPSVFEQIVEGGAGVVWPLSGFARGFFFDHDADGIKLAVVALVFGRDAGGDGLIAFEAAGGIEVLTLFAGVQIEAALGTLAEGSGQILKQGAALGTAGDGARSRHVDGARAESIFSLRTWTWGRWLVEFFFWACAGILISVLAILTVGQKRPPGECYRVRSLSAFEGFGHKGFFGT